MKTTVLIAVLVGTYFLMLNVVVNKEAENKKAQANKSRLASVNGQDSGL